MPPFGKEHFTNWIESLTLDNGDAFRLEPFQESFIADLFLGKPANWLIVPEGSGKSTLLAAVALYWGIFKPLSYVSVAAASRENAEVLFRQAQGFILRSEIKDVEIQEGYRRLKFANGARVQIWSSADRTSDGQIADLMILDELHRHKSLDLYLTWLSKTHKRKGQLCVISTAGEPYSQFELLRDQMRQDGIQESSDVFVRSITDNYVLHDWGVHEGDVEDLQLVKRANPFSGITLDYLQIKRNLPGMTLSWWSRATCNRPARSDSSAISELEWFKAVTDEPIPAGVPISVGLDVAWKYDTTALVPLYWKSEEERILGSATVLVPPRDGTSLDPSLIESALITLHQRNPLGLVVMDTSKAEQLATWIEREFDCTVIERGQSNAAAIADYNAFMDALRNGQLKHLNDPALNQAVLNAIARTLPYGDVRFDRPHQSRTNALEQDRRVIDALTAASMVHCVVAANSVTPTSVYDTRGVVVL